MYQGVNELTKIIHLLVSSIIKIIIKIGGLGSIIYQKVVKKYIFRYSFIYKLFNSLFFLIIYLISKPFKLIFYTLNYFLMAFLKSIMIFNFIIIAILLYLEVISPLELIKIIKKIFYKLIINFFNKVLSYLM